MARITIFMAFMGLALMGCNTMEGMGKDVKGAGKSLEQAAKKNKS
jgi:predicted small secreted protein